MRGLAPTLDGMADLDPYRVLGLEPEPGLSEAVIKKAYRKKALVLHPDKRAASEREKAQREFDQLQKAYDILLDPEARAALENLAKARAASRARAEQQDAKRRKLREDLEARERAAERGKNEEEEAKERLRGELARLRRDFATRKRAYDRETAATTTPEEPAREARFARRRVARRAGAPVPNPQGGVAKRREQLPRQATPRRVRPVRHRRGRRHSRGKEEKGKRAGGIRGSRDGGASRLGAGGRRRESAARRSSRRPAAGMDHAGARRRGEDRDVGKETAGAATGAPTRLPPGSGIFPGGVSAGGGSFPGGSASASRSAPGASSRVPEGTWRIGITRAWCWIGCGARRRRRVS